MPKISPMRPVAPRRDSSASTAGPFVSTWSDLPRTTERRLWRRSAGPGPRTMFVLATYGVVLLSIVAPL